MTESPNPFAAAAVDDHVELEPIHFAGTRTPEDLRVTLRNAPPLTLRSKIWLVIPICLIGAIAIQSSINPVTPSGFRLLLLFPLIYFGLRLWVQWIQRVTPAYRARVRRVNKSANHQLPISGWIDEHQLVLMDKHSILRASWEQFGPVLIFPTHLLIPLIVDPGRRTCLPWRFFNSPREIHEVLRFLKSRIGIRVNRPPSLSTLYPPTNASASDPDLADNPTNPTEPTTTLPPDAMNRPAQIRWVQNLDEENWPFESDASQHARFEIDRLGDTGGIAWLLKAICLSMLRLFTWLLPLWAGIAIWLQSTASGELQSGGFQWQLWATISGGALCWITFLLLIRYWRLRRHAVAQPMTIAVRDTGIHISQDTFASWFRLCQIKEVLIEKQAAGWIARETEETIRISHRCFNSLKEFEAFKDCLARLRITSA